MKNNSQEDLRKIVEALSEEEHRVLTKLAESQPVARNINDELDNKLTFGQRLSDNIARFGGSWRFIIICIGALSIWILLNNILSKHAFDPYPYILLNLVLSMMAALQAPVIMMSQNRQSERDRLDASHDYEVNLKAELEVGQLHDKLDKLISLHDQLNNAFIKHLEAS